MRYRSMTGVVVAAFLAAWGSQAQASFHQWLPEEAFSNASGTVQFLEFADSSDGENLLTNTVLKSNANTFTFPQNLPSSSTAGKNFMVGTAGFAALPGAPAPDYIIPDNFFSVSGDSLFLAGTIQPFFTFTSGQMPTDGTHSLSFNGSTFSTTVNSPTNFSGVSGSVSAVPEPASLGILAAASGLGLLVRRRPGRGR